MLKFQCISFAFVLLLATTYGAGTQRRFLRTRQFARQEAAADVPAVTPYPSADEIKPEIPFDESAAANTPDEVYGPPEVSLTNVPDEVYGPPEVDVNSLIPAESELAPEDVVPEVAPEELPVPAEQSARLQVARRARLQRLKRPAAYRRAAQLKTASVQQKRRI